MTHLFAQWWQHLDHAVKDQQDLSEKPRRNSPGFFLKTLGGLAYALLLHWHAPPQQSTAVEICVMVFSFLPVVIWPTLQITPVYTVVKTMQQPVSNLAERTVRGSKQHQLACDFRRLTQLIHYWGSLVWAKDFLSNLDQGPGARSSCLRR